MKDVNSLKGIHGAGTMQSRKKRSIPRVQSSTYLDLYMLDKEKERLLKEDKKLSMRKGDILRRLEEIEHEMSRMQKGKAAPQATTDATFPQCTSTQVNGSKKEFKTMALSY